MTRDAIIALLGTLKTAYPYFYKNLTKTETMEVIELWAKMFADDDNYITTKAVEKLIQTNKFAPTIADIREKMQEMTTVNSLDEGDAWKILLKAISKSGYSDYKLWQELPEPIKSITSARQIHDWGQMESEDVNTVVQSNFLRAYRIKMQEKKEWEMLSESAKEAQKKIREMVNIKQIGE
ncbi:MAG: replicative helicase loader/inhibitor [Clostridia bacterium]|nr:replicative helicase loader/inhibitor [Clostridia bacterium]